MIFGYFLPSLRRRRMLNSPIALAPFGKEKAVIPARPVRPEPPPPTAPPVAAAAAPAAPEARPVSSFAPRERPTTAMDAIPVEARAARAREAEVEAERPMLKLQVAGDTPRREAPARDNGIGSATLRLEKAQDGTLQFLPGKLEIVEGRGVGQELRFVRTAGADGQSITFGRNEGPQYRHIQLEEHTVSRLHAKMSLEGKTWTLTNLSKTNPVVVNGLALSEETPAVVLRDGDRIEMGEVIFRFRSR